jgi:hypothetical protein
VEPISKQHDVVVMKYFLIFFKILKVHDIVGGDSVILKLFTFSAPNDLSNDLRKYCTRALNHPVYAYSATTAATQLVVIQKKNRRMYAHNINVEFTYSKITF